MNRATRRKRMKESLKTTSKENATAIVNQRYRQELEDYWKQQGRLEGLTELIAKKLAKGKSIEEIAEALEQEEGTIEKIIKEMMVESV